MERAEVFPSNTLGRLESELTLVDFYQLTMKTRAKWYVKIIGCVIAGTGLGLHYGSELGAFENTGKGLAQLLSTAMSAFHSNGTGKPTAAERTWLEESFNHILDGEPVASQGLFSDEIRVAYPKIPNAIRYDISWSYKPDVNPDKNVNWLRSDDRKNWPSFPKDGEFVLKKGDIEAGKVVYFCIQYEVRDQGNKTDYHGWTGGQPGETRHILGEVAGTFGPKFD